MTTLTVNRSGLLLVSCAVLVLLWRTDVTGQTRVTTVAGGYVGDGNQATPAAVQDPQFAAVDSGGNLYVSDYRNHRIRKISTTGIITTIAGTGIAGASGDLGLATSAKINLPTGVAV